MPLILVWLFTLPPALALAALLRRKFEETLALWLFGLLAAAYFLGIFGLLRLAPFLLYAAVLASLAVLFHALFIKKTVRPTGLITVGLAAFLLLSAAGWWMCRGRLYAIWDEFSHWGLCIKNTYYLNGLYTLPQSTDLFKEYPPGLAVLQYTFLKAAHLGFREDLALFTSRLLGFAALIYPMRRLGWKTPLASLLYTLLAFALPNFIVGDYYHHTSMDSLLSLTAGVLMLMVLLPGKKDGFGQGMACLTAFVLSLLKSAGAGLAVLVWLAGLVVRLAAREKAAALRPGASLPKRLLAGAAPLLAVLLATGSWRAHLWAMQVPPRADGPGLSLAGLGQLLSGNAPAYMYDVPGNVLGQITQVPHYGTLFNFSAPWFLLVFALLAAAGFWLVQKACRRQWLAASAGVLGVILLYILSLILTYQFAFAQVETVILSSFRRYLDTVLFASLLFFVLGVLLLSAEKPLKIQLPVLLGLSLMVPLFLNLSTLASHLLHPQYYVALTRQRRYFPQQTTQRIAQLGQQQPRVYVIAQLDDGFVDLSLRFEMAPDALPQQMMSIGTLYPEPPPFTAPYSVEEWERILYDGFDYVYLFSIDGPFTTQYRPLFAEEDDIENGSMLRVVRLEDGRVQLQSVHRYGPEPEG